MATFSAVFVDREGRRREGRFVAGDAAEVRAKLTRQARRPVRITEAGPSGALVIPVRELVPLLHQLELQLRAGVTADEAFRQLAEDAPEGPGRSWLLAVHREVAQGQPIHAVCRRFPRIFPAHLAAVIEAGEMAAQLPEALRGLAAHFTAGEELRRTARRALIYPVIVLAATVGLIGFLLAGVVPKFAEIFAALQLPLPALTVFLIRASEAVRQHGVALLGAGAVGLVILRVAVRRPGGRWLVDRAILRVPVVGDIVRHLATARFAAHLRLLHEAGIPLLDALATGAVLTGHRVLERQLLAARAAVALGKPLYAALPKGHDFPGFLVPALKAGETAGQLGAALRHVEDYAAGRARERLVTALALLEPLLLGLLTAVVGAIALSFFLPLVSLLGGVNAR